MVMNLSVSQANIFRAQFLPFGRLMKLFVFDLENTLIFNEFLPELATLVGHEAEVDHITRLGIDGSIDWVEGFRQRARFLQGITRQQVERKSRELRLVPGALGFVRSLRGRGHKIGLITGGPSELAREAHRLFGADVSVANDFLYDGERMTGEVVIRVTPATKAMFAVEMARSLGIARENLVAFADGAMDADLLGVAKLALAVNSNGKLKKWVDYEVRDFEDAYHWLLREGAL